MTPFVRRPSFSIVLTLALAAVLASAAPVLTSDQDKIKPVNDAGKRATIKSVAVLSVYGPETMSAGFSKFKEQAVYDAIELEFVKRLEASGLAVTPPAQTKALLAQVFLEAYLENASKEMKRNGDRMRPAIEKGYALKFPDSPAPSQNTRVLFGTSQDYSKSLNKSQTHENSSDEKGYKQPPAAYDAPLMKTLVALAPKLSTDGFLMLRVIPDIPATVAKKASRFNPLGRITEGMNAIRAIKEGDHGFVTFDLSIYTKSGELAYYNQIVRMSQESTGKGGGFNLTYSDDAATRLIASAADRALQALFEDLGKK